RARPPVGRRRHRRADGRPGPGGRRRAAGAGAGGRETEQTAGAGAGADVQRTRAGAGRAAAGRRKRRRGHDGGGEPGRRRGVCRGPAALEAAERYLPPAAKARLEAVLLRAEGRADEAAARLEQALRLAPGDVDTERERGRLLLERGDADAARVPLARVYAQT